MTKRWYLLMAAVAVLLALGGSNTALAQFPAASGGQPRIAPFRPVNPNYLAIKAQLDAQAAQDTGAEAADIVPTAPVSFVKWTGNGSTCNCTPADPNGAVGPDRYFENINENIGAFKRAGGLISTASESAWTGLSSGGDPEIMWSPHDNRFYASMFGGDFLTLNFGFSKTATPTTAAADWCFYNTTFGVYGSSIPDYNKLGDTAEFLLFGINHFTSGGSYIGSDVAWVTKPPVGTIQTCPAISSFSLGAIQNIKNADGTLAGTPNPAKQTDSSSTGYVVANEDPGGLTSTHLTVYTVTNGGGFPILSAPVDVPVASYAYPPSAPQKGNSKTLDTLDARLMSAWASPDPSHNGTVAVWTGHTVTASTGGTGAEFRWYEINPSTGALIQNGTVKSSAQYVYMGAISPDRNGTTGKFGSNALMVFNTSSKKAFTSVRIVSVVGGVQSGMVNLITATAPESDFSCTPTCRWGDYSGASPDPASTTKGQVWGTAMYSGAGNPGWKIENFGATP